MQIDINILGGVKPDGLSQRVRGTVHVDTGDPRLDAWAVTEYEDVGRRVLQRMTASTSAAAPSGVSGRVATQRRGKTRQDRE